VPKFITVKDLATLFQKDEETIRRWIRDGDVFPNAFKVKDGFYVPVSDVKKLMKKNSDETEPMESKQKPAPRVSKGFVTGWK
jgi:predicted site-specific integrase-resolvase